MAAVAARGAETDAQAPTAMTLLIKTPIRDLLEIDIKPSSLSLVAAAPETSMVLPVDRGGAAPQP
jgi:hypothetical protein